MRHGPPIYHSFTHDCLLSCDHFAICTLAIISIQGSSAYWGFTTLLCFCFSSVLICLALFLFSSAFLCLLLHVSLCVCLFSACRLLFASLTQFCYFLHFYHFFLSCSRAVEQHVRYSPTLVSGQATSIAKGIFFSDYISSFHVKYYPLFLAFFLPSHNIKEPTRIFRPFTFTFSANYFRLFCHSTTVYNHGIGSKCKNYALMFLAAQCSNIEEEFLLKRDESWRKSVKKKGLSRPALC